MNQDNQKNNLQDICIAKVAKDIEFIKSELSDIIENHLKEINGEIKDLKIKIELLKEELNKRPTWGITFLVSLSIGLITFIVAYFFGH